MSKHNECAKTFRTVPGTEQACVLAIILNPEVAASFAPSSFPTYTCTSIYIYKQTHMQGFYDIYVRIDIMLLLYTIQRTLDLMSFQVL